MGALIRGAFAGTAATAPMTAVMFLLWRFLPRQLRYPLPPRLITANLLRRLRLKRATSRKQETVLTWVLHFAYGGAMGALFSLFFRALRLPVVLAGTLYGIMVWLGSYEGLLPTVNLLADADSQPERRNAVMIAAHLVWGACTGLLVASLSEEEVPQ
ncbi:MAG: DUF1440 domain-containing protein [Anaerolineae bacterium]|nr:DUF1440 domain-containing protein [Anaerolineae bacterium]